MKQPSDKENPALIVAKLDELDTIKAFDCGDEDLNDFILRESPFYRKEKLAVRACSISTSTISMKNKATATKANHNS